MSDTNTENRLKEVSNKAASLHWNRKPVGCQRSVEKPGEGAYFDEIRQYRYGYETPFIPSVFRFDDLADKRVLEIGVGNGIDAVEIMKNGAEYWGVDITERHLDLTKKNIEASFPLRDRPFHLVNGDLLDHELGVEFDVVYSFGVLHHIEHEPQYLKKIHNILKSDGTLRIALYSKYSFFNAYLFVTWLLVNRCKSSFTGWQSHRAELTKIDEPVTIKIRSKAECVRMLNEAGFQVVRYSKKGFTQNNIPLIGRFLSPTGPILDAFAGVLGWYHTFICEKKH